MAVDLEALMKGDPKKKGRRPVSEARRRELVKRNTLVQGMAVAGIRRLHPEDWAELRRQAFEIVNAERGELPS